MHSNLVSNDGVVSCVSALGQITQNAFGPEDEPLACALGDGVYSTRVLLDLHGAEYMDSRGVGWLLKIHRRFRQAGGIVVMHSIPPVIQDVLRVLRMDEVLNISDDAQTARAAAGVADV